MHDGSETTEDSMILEVTLVAGAGYALPGYLQGRLRFPLHVNVTPVNDPPLLEILTAKVLRLAQVRHKRIYHIYIYTIRKIFVAQRSFPMNQKVQSHVNVIDAKQFRNASGDLSLNQLIGNRRNCGLFSTFVSLNERGDRVVTKSI